jgi:hypothetical protein
VEEDRTGRFFGRRQAVVPCVRTVMWHPPVAESASKLSISPARTVRGSGEGVVGREGGLEVKAFLVGGACHFFFCLLARTSSISSSSDPAGP